VWGSAVQRDCRGGNPVERRTHLVQQVVRRHIRVLLGELVAKTHGVLAERDLIGKPTERRVLDMAVAKCRNHQRVIEIDENGEGDRIVDRSLGIGSELLVFDAEAALGPSPLALIAADWIDGVIAERVRLPARLGLRQGLPRPGLRIGGWARYARS
jgi:hypothetical protein